MLAQPCSLSEIGVRIIPLTDTHDAQLETTRTREIRSTCGDNILLFTERVIGSVIVHPTRGSPRVSGSTSRWSAFKRSCRSLRPRRFST